MARHKGGHVKQVTRGDPMTTPQYSSSPLTQERAPTNMRFVNAMGGTSLNVSKSRKQPAVAVTTPQRPLKRRQSVIDTALQAASPQRPQSLIQAKRSLLLGDVEKRQSSVPPHNDVEGNSSQRSASRQERSTSASHPTSVHRNSPRVSPRRHTQLARNERESTPRRSPLRYNLLDRDACESTPRRSPRLSHRQQTRLADNEDLSPELSRRGFLQEASNSPLETDSAHPPAKKITRGITTLPKVAIRDTDMDKLKVEVFEKSLVGTFNLECILEIGMWVRQSDNFPLNMHLFRNMPEEKIARVSKLVRDYYILVPNDENAEEAIRTQMRLAYVRYRSELTAHYRSFDSHEEALRHPSPRIRNVDDWPIMCDFFNTDLKFKDASEKARAARKAHALNHTNGTESFARKAYDRVNLKFMFMVTHKARKLGKLCKDWQAEMNQLSEQVRRGEVNYTPEEIYAMVVDPPEEIYACSEYLNVVLKTLGCDPVPDDIEDESLDEREHEVDDGFTWDDLQEDGNDYAGDDDDLQVDGFADDNDDKQEKELSGG
ncbi:hypothetical protein MKW98_021068 [Papaver atlanticum]|uniref:Uncharacterized protein n=1 Tax=Papaver atlanticum TaxID=357466 RepID=A0AAD4XU14_9MAGN|nr:hypothetical protein MKW98_021068 [Papaver atlanticum]